MRSHAPLLALMVLATACEAGDDAVPVAAAPTPTATATVEIGIHRIEADVADTPARRRRGLSGRPSLAAGRGMLFPYEPPERPFFWMPDMHFDIDIVWIRAGRIVDVHARVPHEVDPPLPRYRPREPIDLVLEVPAGTADQAGWRIGDAVRVSPTPRYRPDAEG